MAARSPLLFRIVASLSVMLATGCSASGSDGTGPDAFPGRTTAMPAPRASIIPSPSPYVGTAPVKPFAVGVRELTVARGADRALPVTIWYPATGTAGGQPKSSRQPAAGRFPVVVFSHGLTARPTDYESLLTRWAAAGFVVAAPTFPHTNRDARQYRALDVLNQPADVSYALTRVLALNQREGDPLRGRLATDRVAAAGHSAGGITTIGLFTTGRDERLSAGIVLAGSALGVGTAFAGAAAPQLFVHGELDGVVSYAAGEAAYRAVPWPKAMLSLPRGDHGRSLLTAGNPAFTVVYETTVDFLRWSLYGDPAAKRRLPADAARGRLATFDNQL